MSIAKFTSSTGIDFYVVDNQEEAQELVKAGCVVYTKAEMAVLVGKPGVEEIADHLHKIKRACPKILIIGAENVSRKDS